MKFNIVESTSKYDFEYQLAYCVEEIESNGGQVIDVKYGGVAEMPANWGSAYYYSAMIIYKE